MLGFLKVKVVVNDKEIYPLKANEPVLVPIFSDHPRIVLTDGYHITPPLRLTYKQPGYFNFDVVCAIDDLQLYAGLLVMSVLYLLGFITGFLFMKLLSFTPLIVLLFYYYARRKNFLQLKRVKQSPLVSRKK